MKEVVVIVVVVVVLAARAPKKQEVGDGLPTRCTLPNTDDKTVR